MLSVDQALSQYQNRAESVKLHGHAACVGISLALKPYFLEEGGGAQRLMEFSRDPQGW